MLLIILIAAVTATQVLRGDSLVAQLVVASAVATTLWSTQPNGDLEPRRVGRSTREGMQSNGGIRRGGRSGLRSGAMRRSGTRGFVSAGQYALLQRVVIKTRVVRHRSAQRGRAALRAHLAYLSREAVTQDGVSGRFYDAKREDLDAKLETRSWRDDRHHFRMIVSLENGALLPHPRDYIREVMQHVKRDLGPLQWIAVDHRNTDNPHTHLLIRGRTEDGADLVIPRDYIAHGFRERAAEVATERLGERTQEQAQAALAKEVRAERYTSLDRTLERFGNRTNDAIHIDLGKVRLSRFALTTQDMLAGRLEFLNQLGLAQRASDKRRMFGRVERKWQIAPDFQPKLRELGERNDIIKQLYRSLGDRAPQVAQQIERLSAAPANDQASRTTVRGILIAKGALDETSDERFVVVEDAKGKPYYGRVWADQALEATPVGGVIEVGRSAHRRQALSREVMAVGGSHPDSQYSTARHRDWLREKRTDLTPPQIERRLRRTSKWVAQQSRRPDTGITRETENTVQVNPPLLQEHIARGNRWLDVRVVASHPLSAQASAEAYTWLDRQIIRERLSKGSVQSDLTAHPTVRDAMTKRADWLLQNGYAVKEPDGARPGTIRFHFDAIDRLKRLEHSALADKCRERWNRSVSFTPLRGTVQGVYLGTEYLHRGPHALIATKQHIHAVPVSREPRFERGHIVRANVVSKSHTQWERPGPRKTLGLDR